MLASHKILIPLKYLLVCCSFLIFRNSALGFSLWKFFYRVQYNYYLYSCCSCFFVPTSFIVSIFISPMKTRKKFSSLCYEKICIAILHSMLIVASSSVHRIIGCCTNIFFSRNTVSTTFHFVCS